jgi:hypothetical protein
MRRRDWSEARAKVDQEGRCRVCGSSWRVEAAHVVPRSVAPNGGEHPDSIVPLCGDYVDHVTGKATKGCHSRYDDKSEGFSLEPYLTASEFEAAAAAAGSWGMAKRIISSSREVPDA